MFQFNKNYAARQCDDSSLNVVFELRVSGASPTNTSHCLEMAKTVLNHYEEHICGWTVLNGGAFAPNDYQSMCQKGAGNTFGFQLPW